MKRKPSPERHPLRENGLRIVAMNGRQLEKLGVPPDCVKLAIAAIQSVRQSGGGRGRQRHRRSCSSAPIEHSTGRNTSGGTSPSSRRKVRETNAAALEGWTGRRMSRRN